MKVALIGSPGAGKTKLAQKLVRRLNKTPLEEMPEGRWKLIDGYVDQLQKRTALPFGALSTIPHNLAVISDRWVREAELQSQGFHTVTCGSIYESIMYSTFSTLFNSNNEAAMVYDQTHYRIMMEALGVLESRTYDYDAIFWLPWTSERELEQNGTWEAVINAKLPEMLDGFDKFAVPLRGTSKENFERVIEVIRITGTWAKIAEDEQRSVRASTDDSSEPEPRSEPVSDVQAEEN
jgi:hypothetical protein